MDYNLYSRKWDFLRRAAVASASSNRAGSKLKNTNKHVYVFTCQC